MVWVFIRNSIDSFCNNLDAVRYFEFRKHHLHEAQDFCSVQDPDFYAPVNKYLGWRLDLRILDEYLQIMVSFSFGCIVLLGRSHYYRIRNKKDRSNREIIGFIFTCHQLWGWCERGECSQYSRYLHRTFVKEFRKRDFFLKKVVLETGPASVKWF